MKGLIISMELFGEREVRPIESKGVKTKIIPQSHRRRGSLDHKTCMSTRLPHNRRMFFLQPLGLHARRVWSWDLSRLFLPFDDETLSVILGIVGARVNKLKFLPPTSPLLIKDPHQLICKTMS